MTIPFKNIPSNIRVPLFYAEVDNSRANTAQLNQRTLIIGQITGSGVAAANVPLLSQGVADAKAQGGVGSMLARMTAKYRENDPVGEVWYLPLADDGAAVAATGSIDFTNAATANGTLSLYIAGSRVQVAITSTQTTAQVATAVAAALTAATDLPIAAAVDGSITHKVDFTAKNAGAVGNDIDIRVNYLGAAGGEVTPTGLAYTIVPMASGATNPSLTTALANCMDMPFDFIVNPYNDTTSLNALKSFLDDTTGRWSYDRQVYGHAFTAYRGTLSTRTTLGLARNNQHETIMGFNNSPHMVTQWAAAVAGAAAVSLRADPGVPLQTLVLNGISAPPLVSRDQLTDRQTLLSSGISTFTVDADGTVRIENLITTYQTNAFSQPDDSYLEIETLFVLMFVLRFMKTRITSKYARCKLAANGTRIAPGSNVITPNIARIDQIAAYQELEEMGYVQNSKAFAAELIVERNANNPNRLDELAPFTLINQLRIFALLAQFRLQ